jgi:streptogramin lyase
MKQGTRNILTFCVALIMVAASILLAARSIIGSRAQSSLASSISNVTTYSVPGSDPWGTAFDSSGRVWVALPGCDLAPSCPSSTPPGKLALFDPVAQSWVTIVSLPKGYGQPPFVAVDQAGKVWFTMPVTNAIGVYDPVAQTVAQWAVPTASVGPWDIAIDSNGKIWFTEHYVNKIGSFDPNAQTFHEIATPASNSNPYGITVDASNNIWFTENTDSVALIGEYTNQGVLNEYKIRNTSTGGTGLTPHLITIDPNGNIWWSEGWVSAIGTLNLAAAHTTRSGTIVFQLPTAATSSLRLLYRPEVATETVIILLKIS